MAGNYFIDYESDRLDDTYATDAELASGLSQKVNSSTYNTAINTLTNNINSKAESNDVYTKASIDTQMSGKADSSAVYTKEEIDTSMNLKADTSVVETQMALKSDKASTYTKTEANSLLSNKANVDDVYNKESIDNKLGDKADTATTYTKNQVDTALTGKASTESVYTKGQIDTQMGDRYTKAEVDLEMADRYTKAEVDTQMGDRYTKAEVDTQMGDRYTKAEVDTQMNDRYTKSEVDTQMGNRYTKADADSKFALQTELGNYALESDIPTLAGGYSASQIDGFLSAKADKAELVYRLTYEQDENGNYLVDGNGNPLRDLNYSLSQDELGTRLYEMDNATAGKQNAGDYITRAEAQQADATTALVGATAGGLLGVSSVVWSGITEGGEQIQKTAGDFFKDVGDFFDGGGGGGAGDTPSLDLSNFITKPYDYSTANPYYGTSNNLKDYAEGKAKNTPTLESGNLQIKSSGVMIDGTTATPLTGYKLQVEGDTLIRNGTKKYLDCYNDKVGIRVDADLIDLGCDVKIVGSTCVEGDLKIDGILKNGADKVFILQEDHDQDITEITDILDDIVNAIPTDENGNNEIPEGETLAYNSQITGLQTQVDNLPTISTVDTFIETKLASLHIIEGENANDPLALKHYLKDEVDALIPDVSNFETTTQLDTRLADYTTLSLFEAHETLMETELADKVDTTTLDNYDTSAQVDTKLSSYDTSAQVDTKLSSYDTSVEVDTKLNSYDTSTQVDNKIAGALADYDTSTEVDTKITNAGVGGHWTKNATTNELSYGAGRVKIDTNGEGLVVQPNTSDTDARINLISGEGDADAYIGFHARNPNSVHGRSVYIGAKASDTATNSVETELHFKVRGNNPYEWDTMVSDMVIKGDGDVEFQSPKLRILGGSWNTKFDLTNEGTICRKYTDTNNVDHGSGLHFSGDYIYPTDASGNLNNDVLSIGFPQHNRFKYIYASDSVFLNDYYEQSGSQYFGKRYNWHPFGILSGMEIENNTTGGNYSQKLHFLTHYYGVSNGRRMTINESGHVGIGTENPVAVLHVQGSRHANIAGGTNATLNWAGTGSGASMFYTPSTTYNVDMSIFASSKIATNADFVSAQGAFTHSDSRIKRDIKELNDDDALVKLRQIQPKTYGYKDIGVRGEDKVIGFIADEVQEVLPEAVRRTTATIPNILEVVNVAEGNIISFTNFNTSNLSETSSLECVDIRSGQEQYISIVKVIDDKTIQVKEDLSNWLGSFDEDGRLVIDTTTSTLTPDEYEALENEEQEGYRKKDDVYEKTMTSYPGNNLYIRGERVNDFRTLKKEMLFAINFSATQELDKSVEKLKVENEELKARLLALEEKINIA